MHIAAYLLAVIFLLAAIGAIADSVGMALVYATLGAGLIWWGRMRGKKCQSLTARKPEKNKPRKITDSMVELPSIGMFGPYAESPNGKYTLVWSDSDPSAGVGGYRQSEYGSYALVHNDAVVCTGKLERPNDGKVANDGTFVLADWRFGDGLKSRLHGFSSDGQEILRHEFSANMFNTGLSDTGKYAVAQLANSPSEDGGCLAFFDLSEGEVLWKKVPETGWADSYRFDEERRKISLVYKNIGTYEYSYEGEFEDAVRWEQDRIRSGSGHDLLAVCREKLEACAGQLSSEDANKFLEIIDRAVAKKEVRDDAGTNARALRMAGEIHEAVGELHLAIEKYESALGLDPKVGVKKKLQQLKKNA
jgi:hypothetical protein